TFTRPTPEGDLSVRVGRPGGVLEVTVALGGGATPEPDLTAVRPAPEPPVFTPPAAPVALPAGLAPPGAAAPPGRGGAPPGGAAPAPRAGGAPRVGGAPPRGGARSVRPTEARPVVESPPDSLPGLFRAALAVPASDVHLEGGSRPWARVAGEVQPLDFGRPLS